MIFLRIEYLALLLIAMAALITFIMLFDHKYFSWIREHWLFNRSLSNLLSSFCFILGICFISIIVLDPREKEIKIPTPVKQSKTVILIDTSTSMLVEDVRPNRLERAALLAKHFARRAGDHQISVMIFADITKKLVPFTSDRDLIDARIDSIKEIRNLNAGTSIESAVAEAARLFNSKEKSVSGNLLVITDGEDHGGAVNIEVPDSLKVAFLGVGSQEGGNIPLKDNRGMFYGYKKNRAITVISKLDRKYFERAVDSKENRRFFEATMTGIPSDEIYEFFNSKAGETKEGEGIIRPLSFKRFAYPGLIFLFVSYLLKFFKPFAISLLVVASLNAYSNEASEDIQERIEMLKTGELSKDEKINLADSMVKYGMHEAATEIYNENLSTDLLTRYPDSYFNWATTLLEKKDIRGALEKYQDLEESFETSPNPDLKKKIRENIKRAFQQESKNKDKSKKDKEKKKNKEKDSSEKKENQDPSESGQGEEQVEPGEESGQSESNPFDPKNADNDPESQSNGDQEEREKPKEKENVKNKTSDAQESDQKMKVPLLEQLKQDDRNLQLKLLDTSTQGGHDPKKKDW